MIEVPYYSFGVITIWPTWIVGGEVDKHLFRVPCEETREVCVEVEAYLGIFFSLCRVVVWSSFDYLHIADGYRSGRRA